MWTKTCSALLVLAYGGAAFGQAPADVDGDGRVSLQEFEQRAAERFARLDRDGDGYLDRSELRGAREGLRAGGRRGPFAAADADGDGALSLTELQAVRPDMTADRFAELDTNHDGRITPDERPRRR